PIAVNQAHGEGVSDSPLRVSRARARRVRAAPLLACDWDKAFVDDRVVPLAPLRCVAPHQRPPFPLPRDAAPRRAVLLTVPARAGVIGARFVLSRAGLCARL